MFGWDKYDDDDSINVGLMLRGGVIYNLKQCHNHQPTTESHSYKVTKLPSHNTKHIPDAAATFSS